MVNRLLPQVGHWYSHCDKGDCFQVVAMDDQFGTIDIQEFDGGIDELDAVEWLQLSIEECVPPEDWSGPVDVIDRNDVGYTDRFAEPVPGIPLVNGRPSWNDSSWPEAPEPGWVVPTRRPTLRKPRDTRPRHH